VEKLVTKTRQGARVHRVYDRAQTPYQRLGAAGAGVLRVDLPKRLARYELVLESAAQTF